MISFPEQAGEVCKPALFSGCFRGSVNKSANMYFHSQSSCKILVCCLKFKQDVRCITKLDCAEGCVSTYPERPDRSAGTASQKSLELLRIFSKRNLTRCHNDLWGTCWGLWWVKFSSTSFWSWCVRRDLGGLCDSLIMWTKGNVSSFWMLTLQYPYDQRFHCLIFPRAH